MRTHRLIPAGLLLAAAILAGCGGSTPSSGAGASPSVDGVPPSAPATGAPATAAPSEPPSLEPSPSASAEAASPTASATPKASPKPGKPATIVFTSLKLDAKDDPEGKNRVFTFDSRGTGTITVSVNVTSPRGTAVLCLSAGGKKVGCTTTDDGRITAITTKRTESFKATVRGSGIATPVVDVAITFPAKAPTVTIANARFDGTDYPDTNGIVANITPRTEGNVTLLAQWGGHPFSYEVDLMEQGGSGSTILADQGPSTGASVSLPVAGANPWRLVLQNIDPGFGVTPMTATVAWP
jgi:predicted small secreted protein